MVSVHLGIDQRFGIDNFIVFLPRWSMNGGTMATAIQLHPPHEFWPYIRSATACINSPALEVFRFGSGALHTIFLMTRAGFPTATLKSGISFVTTLPAPIVTPLPMVTPGTTTTLPPSQQSSPIVIGAPPSGPLMPSRRKGSRGCEGVYREQFGPRRVRAPMVIKHVSRNTQLKLM